MLSGILGFFVFTTLLFLASFIGACVRCAYEWIEYERVPSFGSRRALVLFLSQLLWYSVGIGILFIGVRYLVIPWFGLASLWAMLSVPVQLFIGWVLMRGWSKEQILSEGMSSRVHQPNISGEETADRKMRSPLTQNWRKSETRTIALSVSVQCFEKTPGGVFRPILDWSLDRGTVITIGPLETVLWDNNFHEVVPFYYNGYRYYLRVHDIKIAGLADRLRVRSNLRVVR